MCSSVRRRRRRTPPVKVLGVGGLEGLPQEALALPVLLGEEGLPGQVRTGEKEMFGLLKNPWVVRYHCTLGKSLNKTPGNKVT